MSHFLYINLKIQLKCTVCYLLFQNDSGSLISKNGNDSHYCADVMGNILVNQILNIHVHMQDKSI